MDDLARNWERIETWLREHGCTSALSALHPPASSVEVLEGGPEYMREMLEEFTEQRDEDPEHWILDPWADPLWLPIAGTIGLMARSLESGSPMPYSRRYAYVPRLDEGPPGRLQWKLDEIRHQDARSPSYGRAPGDGVPSVQA
ncbi:hypothetical protein [Streptomyces sp. NPDC091371]|uniref:hypothetical protein n=1 Tax=Streptomyces sp. NPDC091371 TaxID=3155303 RepID=UPI003443BA5F